MRKLLPALFAAVLLCALPSEAAAAQVEVRLAPVSRTYAPPPLGRKQGWLTIVNRDWKPYTVSIMKKGRMALTEGEIHGGGTIIRSGQSVTMAVEKDTWELFGSSGGKLKCKVREGRTSTISLEPYGYANSAGLRGVSNDGEDVRAEVLVEAYAPPPVVVQRPPVVVERPVIVERPVVVAPPPPVIVHRPPVVVHRPYHRPPPPRRRNRDGWDFTFGFGSH